MWMKASAAVSWVPDPGAVHAVTGEAPQDDEAPPEHARVRPNALSRFPDHLRKDWARKEQGELATWLLIKKTENVGALRPAMGMGTGAGTGGWVAMGGGHCA